MSIDFTNINSKFRVNKTFLDGHTPSLTWNDGSTFKEGVTYGNFGSVVLSKDRSLKKGELLKDKMIQAKVDKATKLGLHGTAFSNFVELDITPKVNAKAFRAKTGLNKSKSIVSTSKHSPTSSDGGIVDVLKGNSVNEQKINRDLVIFTEELVKQSLESNKIAVDKNEILLEQNRILELSQLQSSAMINVLSNTLVSISQSLEFIPTMIEQMGIHSDRQADLMNTQNSHAFQKNVNDSFYYDDDKNSAKGSAQSLYAMSNNLASMASTHSDLAVSSRKIEQHQEKQKEHAENMIKDFDDENSAEYKGIFDEALDFLSGAYDEITDNILGSDVNIFEHLLKEGSMTEKDVKNGY